MNLSIWLTIGAIVFSLASLLCFNKAKRPDVAIEKEPVPVSRIICCNLFQEGEMIYYKAVEFGSVCLAVTVDRQYNPVFGQVPIIFYHDQKVRRVFKS